MKNIDELRKEIDNIDEQLINLFEQRMNISKDIADYKSANHLDIFNKERELIVLDKNINKLNNKEYKEYAYIFINTLMELSKQIQKKHIEEKQ